MSRMLVAFIVCYLLLLGNVENSKLTKSQVLSRLRQRSPSRAPPSPASMPRQQHICLTNCFFILFFNETLALPDDCTGEVTSDACDMAILIDYPTQLLYFVAFQNSGELIFGDTTYNSSETHYVIFSPIAADPYTHVFDYVCAIGDICEWEYVQQTLPELLLLDYQPLHQLLLPKMVNPNGHPNLTECYTDVESVNCSSGSCAYVQDMNDTTLLEPIRGCSPFDVSSILIGASRYSPGPAIHDNGYIDIVCDTDQCNSQSNTDEIKRILFENSNEYIYLFYSSGVKLQWTMSLIFILITCFQF